MPQTSENLFASVADKDYFHFFNQSGVPDARRIAETLNYRRREVSVATDIPYNKVRLEPDRIPKELVERVTEWATAINLVAEHFQDTKKAILWFHTPNPMLGSISPREMIITGRFKKLLKFIQIALSGNP